MKKRIISIITAITMICAVLPAHAVDAPPAEDETIKILSGWYDEFKFAVLKDNTIEITDYKFAKNAKKLDVVVPDVIDGKPVTSIGKEAFLPDWVYSKHGYYRSHKKIKNKVNPIRSFTLPKTVNNIGESAFEYCNRIKTIELPDGVKTIGSYAFRYCKNLKKINFPTALTKIKDYAFSDCKSLAEAVFSENLKSIEDYAFEDCDSLSKVKLPKSLIQIGTDAFSNCTSLKSIVIPKNVKKIGDYAFQKCKNLKTVRLPKNLKTLGTDAFSDCTSLKKAILPDDIHNIEGTFKGCTSLTEVLLPRELKYIGEYTFKGCKSLVRATVPAKTEWVEADAFDNCPRLKLRVNKHSLNLKVKDNVMYTKDGRKLLCCINDKQDKFVVPQTVKVIADSVFCASPIKEIVLPEGLKKIGNYAFYGYKGKVNIPGTVKRFGDYSFCKTKIKSVDFSEKAKVKDYAFSHSDIRSVTFGEKTYIGDSAFYKTKIKSLTLPKGAFVAWNSFEKCSDLTDITIEKGVVNVGNGAFANCKNLKTVTVKDKKFEFDQYLVSNIWSDISTPKFFKNITIYCYSDSATYKNAKKLKPARVVAM